MAKKIENKIEQYFSKSLHFSKEINQEDREHTRTKKEQSNSNRTKTNSNQKGAHYV